MVLYTELITHTRSVNVDLNNSGLKFTACAMSTIVISRFIATSSNLRMLGVIKIPAV